MAEFLGTMLLTLIGCFSTIGWQSDYQPSITQIALSFGITVATLAQCLGHVSGCHINPAVSVGLLVARQISLLRTLCYILVQCVGAVVGSALLMSMTPKEVRGALGSTTVSAGLTGGQAMGVELMVTFLLVLVVLAVTDDSRQHEVHGAGPLAIGLSITACHLGAIKYTGSSMNPARSFGPAVITGLWANHWVYWVGPLLGGALASLTYSLVFRAQSLAVGTLELTEIKQHGSSK